MLRTYILAAGIFNGLFLGRPYSTGQLYAPRYISPWVWMDTSNSSTTEHMFLHGFNENPIKAEVQVREKGNHTIFPGIKSANVIKVMDSPVRAGVLCIYNRTHVRVMGPPKIGQIDSFLIHTGDSSKWIGDGHFENSTKAEVRVRVWHKDDFPPHSFETNITLNTTQLYGQKQHNVSGSRVYMTAQLYFIDGWIGEAQGSESNYEVNMNTSARCGGVVFSGSKTNVTVWAPRGPHDVIFTYYGWGSCSNEFQCMYNSTTVHITIWGTIFNSTCARFGTLFAKGSKHNKVFVRSYSLSGTGAAMMDIDQRATGLVYGYNNATQHIMIWHPLRTQYIFKVDFDDSNTAFKATSAEVNVCFWKNQVRLTTTTETTITTSTSTGLTTISDVITTTTGKTPTEDGVTQDRTSSIKTAVILNANQYTGSQTMPTSKITTSTIDNVSTSTPSTSIELSSVTTHPTDKPSTGHYTSSTVDMVSSELTTYNVIPAIDTSLAAMCTQLNCIFLILCTCIELSDLGKNILIDFSEIENNYLLFTCKQGYPSHSGDFNRTFHVENGSLSGQTPVCKERNPLRTNIEIEERVKEIVKNLTIPVNSTAKYRRSLQSALDRRTSSRVIGIISGLAIGGFIALIVLNDMILFFRFISTR